MTAQRVTPAPLALRYGLEDRPAPLPTLLFALQHVMIMFGAMLASPLAIGQALNLPPDGRAAMITGVMFGCGVGTLLSSLGLFWIGGRLPLLLGGYTVFIGPFVAIARAESPGAAVAAMLLGGLALFAASPLIGRLRSLFPPLVVGTLLLLTGVSLIKIAATLAAGAGTPYFGQPAPLWLLAGSIALITVLLARATGMVRLLAVFIAVIGAYAAALAAGLGNLQPILAAAWFRPPALLPFGLAWPSPGAVATILVYYLAAATYTMSITIALCGMLGVEGSIARVRGAIAADGVGSCVAMLFGGVPLISYDQNVGAVALTGVGSRFVVALSGLLLIVLACLPKAVAIVTSAPAFVLGGVLIFMFGTIAAIGARMLAPHLAADRSLIVVAVSLGLSAAVSFAPPDALAAVPGSIRILAGDGIVVGTVTAILLNALLPHPSRPA